MENLDVYMEYMYLLRTILYTMFFSIAMTYTGQNQEAVYLLQNAYDDLQCHYCQ